LSTEYIRREDVTTSGVWYTPQTIELFWV
jgi:hypothetical protein